MKKQQQALKTTTQRRAFGTSAPAKSEKSISVLAEAGMGSVLGLILGGVWMVWASGEFAKLDAFNRKNKEAEHYPKA